MAMLERTSQFTSSDQTGCMSHIAHEPSLLIIGNLAQILVIPISWISRGTANDETWFEGLCRLFERGVVDQLGLGFESVREGLEIDGGCGDFLFGGVVAVSEVTTIWETESHKTVLRLNQGGQSCKAFWIVSGIIFVWSKTLLLGSLEKQDVRMRSIRNKDRVYLHFQSMVVH